ncbi:MAG TPA: hypothetical protein VNN25_06105, partial [Thermoanaerobaculia bacterium]|nr:hypothetical protein [Thermoanaerobaculia bacterium]
IKVHPVRTGAQNGRHDESTIPCVVTQNGRVHLAHGHTPLAITFQHASQFTNIAAHIPQDNVAATGDHEVDLISRLDAQ